MSSVTRALAEALVGARYEQLPHDVIAHARRSVTDWLGSALAGSIEKPARLAQQVAARFGVSNEATVFGAGRASAPVAAFANGVASHILELDDIHKGSTVHAAAPIIPAALAVAEREHADGRAFLAAVAIGYEAAFRIGEAVNPSHYYFFHPTGTVATFGAAAAAGSLMRLGPDQMVHALGSAGTQAAALWEFNADGAMSKHLHPGKAAMNGVIAADLARAGFTGATRILEGERGFFEAFTRGAVSYQTAPLYDASRVTDGLGTRWKIGENGYKLYSCCGHTHTAVDCALEIRARRRWSKDDVLREASGITIETYGPGYEIVKEMNPRTPYQAKFSMAYCVATALLEGALGLEQFSNVSNPAVSELLRRTRVSAADDLTAKYPASWPARLAVETTDGVERASSEFPKGHPERPVSTAELEQKFTTLVASRFGRQIAEAMLGALHSIGDCGDMAMVFRGPGDLGTKEPLFLSSLVP
ncbi:MAG: MmgE/PrpD family protein [Acidobacteria bacterium]|nr:MAG: MmgE/PrpD family protein [Acidobacteriota bacterium]PYR76578.1 MAG: MmgE/PrpD family protein [Acidobacteriota bacterium]